MSQELQDQRRVALKIVRQKHCDFVPSLPLDHLIADKPKQLSLRFLRHFCEALGDRDGGLGFHRHDLGPVEREALVLMYAAVDAEGLRKRVHPKLEGTLSY